MKTVMTSNITSNSKWAHRIFNRISILGVDGVGAGGLGTDSGASSGGISNAPTPSYWRKFIAMMLFDVKMSFIARGIWTLS